MEKHIICINENEGEIKHLKLCKISLYLFSSASVPPVQAQFIWRVCSTSETTETWSRESKDLLTTFLLSFSIYSLHQACMSNTGPEEKVHERISAAPSNRSFTISQTLRDEQQNQEKHQQSNAWTQNICWNDWNQKYTVHMCFLKRKFSLSLFYFFFKIDNNFLWNIV